MAHWKKENYFTNFLPYFESFVLTLFRADSFFGNFRAFLVTSTPFPFRLFFWDLYTNLYFFLYKIIKKTIETYELSQKRLFTRVSTIFTTFLVRFWTYLYWPFFLFWPTVDYLKVVRVPCTSVSSARKRQSLLGAPADRAIFSCQLLAGVGHRLKWEQIAQCSSQWRPTELAVGTCWHSACNNAQYLPRAERWVLMSLVLLKSGILIALLG